MLSATKSATSSASAATIETRSPASAGSWTESEPRLGLARGEAMHAQTQVARHLLDHQPAAQVDQVLQPTLGQQHRDPHRSQRQQQARVLRADRLVDHAPLQLQRQGRERDHQQGQQRQQQLVAAGQLPDESVEPAGQRLFRADAWASAGQYAQCEVERGRMASVLARPRRTRENLRLAWRRRSRQRRPVRYLTIL